MTAANPLSPRHRSPTVLMGLAMAWLLGLFSIGSDASAADPGLGTISGTITAVDSSPAGDFCAEVYRLDESSSPDDPSYSLFGFARTNTSGEFTKELPAGLFTIRFHSLECSNHLFAPYAVQWWDRIPQGQQQWVPPADASLIQVAEGSEVSGIDHQLPGPATLTGRVVVTDPRDAGTTFGLVLHTPGGSWIETISSDVDGRFTATDIIPGDYKIQLAVGLAYWWVGGDTLEEATAFTVPPGETLELNLPGDFHSGIGVAPQPDEVVCIDVFDNSGADSWSEVLDGWVEFTVSARQVKIRLEDCGGHRLVTEWFEGGATRANAPVHELVMTDPLVVEPNLMPLPGDEVGYVDPTSGRWHIPGYEPFYFGIPGDLPFLGDWNGDGTATPGLYRPQAGFAYVRDSLTTGVADDSWYMGDPGDIPLAGDWDGDGTDSFGVYRPSEGKVYLRNSNSTGPAEITPYYFGVPGDKPFSGDFDGDGDDDIALHRESTGLVYFRLIHATGVADAEFYWGIPGDAVVAGDWNQDGIDTPALVRPGEDIFYFRDSNTQGGADGTISARPGGWPVVLSD